jgi:hypothetical protein
MESYITFPISLPRQISFDEEATHYVYMRPHEPRIPDATTHRSLFLVNVPFDADEENIKSLLSTSLALPIGRIESVHFDDDSAPRPHQADETALAVQQTETGRKGKKRKRGSNRSGPLDLNESTLALPRTWPLPLHRGGTSAIAIFVDRASLDAVLKAARKVAKQGRSLGWPGAMKENLGWKRYLAHHNLRYPDRGELLHNINAFMTAFAQRETALARARTQRHNEPDEDGFVTVTSKHSVRMADAKARLEAQAQREREAKEKGRGTGGLEDFYRFQSRERRKERAGELLKKFEEDREKVRRMREGRGRVRPEA